jgi:hypothetical protein
VSKVRDLVICLVIGLIVGWLSCWFGLNTTGDDSPTTTQYEWMTEYCGGHPKSVDTYTNYTKFYCDDFRSALVPKDVR